MSRIWKFLCTHPAAVAITAVAAVAAPLTMFHG